MVQRVPEETPCSQAEKIKKTFPSTGHYGEYFIDFLAKKGLLGGDQKHLVLLDGCSSHLFNFDFIGLLQKASEPVIAIYT